MVDAADSKTGLSIGQLVSLMIAVGATSGLGGAYTATATDAVQDTKIERVEDAVEDLRDDLTEMRDAVIVMVPQVDAIEEDVAEIRRDLKEILKAVAQNGHVE